MSIVAEKTTVKAQMMTMMLENNSCETADFAPLIGRQFNLLGTVIVVQVKPALHEVMTQALSLEHGPQMSQLCALLLRVARGDDCAMPALELLFDMANAFDKHAEQLTQTAQKGQ